MKKKEKKLALNKKTVSNLEHKQMNELRAGWPTWTFHARWTCIVKHCL